MALRGNRPMIPVRKRRAAKGAKRQATGDARLRTFSMGMVVAMTGMKRRLSQASSRWTSIIALSMGGIVSPKRGAAASCPKRSLGSRENEAVMSDPGDEIGRILCKGGGCRCCALCLHRPAMICVGGGVTGAYHATLFCTYHASLAGAKTAQTTSPHASEGRSQQIRAARSYSSRTGTSCCA